MGIRFYDTNALIELQEKVFEERFVISSQTLVEIENIKTFDRKSEDVKFKARSISRLLNKYSDKYNVHIITLENYRILEAFDLPITPDNLIASSAYLWDKSNNTIDFYTYDNNLKLIAKSIFNLNVVDFGDIENFEEYIGYKDICLSDDEMAYFYEHLNNNIYNLLINEYLVIRNKDNDIVDKRKWIGDSYIALDTKTFKSKIFGNIKPLDDIQMLAFDSLNKNEITLLYGKAGSGKTTLPLAYIMQGLETQKFDKCYIVFHYEPLKGSRTLGYEKGSHTEKLLNTGSLGNILSTKFADYKYITSMLGDKLEIIPTANIRGVEFGANDVVFVTECQSITPYVLKTIIQRCKQGCKQIYEGDLLEQSDVAMPVSGMKRMLDIFKGYEGFGCVKLMNNYRSKACDLADRM